jgi:ribosome-associated protein
MRSGGPGGQHINKVETGVTLAFDISGSPTLDDNQRRRLLSQLKGRINKRGILRLTERRERSQRRNRDRVIARFGDLLAKALKEKKPRIATVPSRKSQTERLEAKRNRAAKKQSRHRPAPDFA